MDEDNQFVYINQWNPYLWEKINLVCLFLFEKPRINIRITKNKYWTTR